VRIGDRGSRDFKTQIWLSGRGQKRKEQSCLFLQSSWMMKLDMEKTKFTWGERRFLNFSKAKVRLRGERE